MTSWVYYPAFLATFISIVGWSYMAFKEHDKVSPRTLSQLGAARKATLTYFRTVLWICGPLFAITMYYFVVPRIEHASYHAWAWSVTVLGEILLGVFPAMGKTKLLHDFLAMVMGVGMLSMSYLFWWSLTGAAMYVAALIALIMSVLAIFTVLRTKNFIVYELLFIFLSHITILVGAVALK